MIRRLLTAIVIAGVSLAAAADEPEPRVVRKSEAPDRPEQHEMVIVGNDTVPLTMKERNFGRYDRGLFNYLFIPRGKWGFGLTASYGELNTEDVQVLSLLSNLDLSGKTYSIKPFISYFIKNNQSVGLRFNYTRGQADLGGLSVDFDEDLAFTLSDISYYSQSYSVSAFYRNYIGINRSKRFGVFNEVDVTVGSGTSRFKRLYDGVPRDTRTVITQGSINFSPGVCVFIQEYVAFNVSFGVFGLNFRREHQLTDGVDEGTRFTSGANFRFNLFNINLGMMVVI
ncbi:MAG: hypothetical protein NC406_04065 [Bacteroides sp.]|nr:hypothetical protein [Bacteroides sp.]MCM1095801.1 hypothetical protein [Terasakiella sp.]